MRLVADKEANTLTIEDNGVGMTRKELQTNLGRIAQSGTKKFTEALGSGNSDATNLIGQVGVGCTTLSSALSYLLGAPRVLEAATNWWNKCTGCERGVNEVRTRCEWGVNEV